MENHSVKADGNGMIDLNGQVSSLDAAFDCASLLFPIELLRCGEGTADTEEGRLHRRTWIAENQADEMIDDKDEAERETEIEQCGDGEERHFQPSTRSRSKRGRRLRPAGRKEY